MGFFYLQKLPPEKHQEKKLPFKGKNTEKSPVHQIMRQKKQ